MAMVAVPTYAQGETPLTPTEPVVSNETGELVHENSGLWFVEFASAPLADGGNMRALNADRRAFARAAANANVQFNIRRDFNTLWNGYSVALTRGTASDLSLLDGVKAIYPVATVSLPETATISPDLSTAIAMTGADVAQSELGYTGQGVRVAVMDTGIDYHHPDLGGCFGPGCRVEAGYDLVGDAFNANPTSSSYNPDPMPDEDPDDCQGHGTHVAGIVGANGDPSTGGALGVAPGVTFGAYRVFGCEGSTTADIMLAMERALADDMDVLNMSIGSAFQWPQYPTAQASDRLVNKGMVVVASIGNSGANGIYSLGAPGVGEKVIGVASFDNSHINVQSFIVNPSGQQVGYLPLSVTPDPPTSGASPEVVWFGRACSSLGDTAAGDVTGKVALIIRGDCTFNEKYNFAADNGAVGVVIYNNVPGVFAGGGVVSRGIYGIGISNADGVHIRGLLDEGTSVTLTWTDERINAPNPTGGLLSSFTSYGLPPDLSFKPDLGAPGGLIRSTYPLELGGYSILSGTSMSAPHVAGGVALLLEARPNTPSQAVDEILQNSADPQPWSLAASLGYLDHAFRQGAGMLDIDDAILATTRISPSELAVGEGYQERKTFTLTLENSGESDVTYDLSHEEGIAVRGTGIPVGGFSIFGAEVSFSAPSVTVPAGASASVDVTITSYYTDKLYGGWVIFTPQDDGQVYRVPYAGYSGDYQNVPVMTLDGYPQINAPDGCFRVIGNACITPTYDDAVPASFSLVDVHNMPHVLMHLDHQVRRLRIDVYDAKTDRAWHTALNAEYLGRNATSTGISSFVWDGTTRAGNRLYEVPDGDYYLVVSVQKALGDDENTAHWETWTSGTITIDRP